jgi:beta-lactamase superfamily II metal-dependent hydrolase
MMSQFRAGRGACLAAVCLSPLAALAATDTLLIDSIDVEGGAATLYITPEGQSLLIDTGWPTNVAAKDPDSVQRIIAAARKHGLSKLDYLLITHYHVDHVGGAVELLGQFPVGTVLDHGPNREMPAPNAPAGFAAFQPSNLYPKYLEALRGHEHRELKAGDTLDIGSLRLTVVTSDAATIPKPLPGAGSAIAECGSMKPMAEDGGEENSRSVGVIMTFGRARIAALGDLTWNIEKALVCPRDKVGPVDLMMVSHHGAHFSNSPALFRALSPRVAIANNGARKGGEAVSYDTVSHSPRVARIWQLHFAEAAGAEHNTAEAYIANPTAADDMYASLEATVSKEGAITVTNGRTGFKESYPPAPRR